MIVYTVSQLSPFATIFLSGNAAKMPLFASLAKHNSQKKRHFVNKKAEPLCSNQVVIDPQKITQQNPVFHTFVKYAKHGIEHFVIGEWGTIVVIDTEITADRYAMFYSQSFEN